MVDGGASLIVVIAGLGYAIVSGTYLFITPQKKLDLLDEANELYNVAVAEGAVPAATQVNISITQDEIIDDLDRLDKTRWGHLKNLRKYKRVKKRVMSHCDTVKQVSRKCLSMAKIAAANERAAKEAAEKATVEEEKATRKRLQSLEQDLCALLGRKFWRRALTSARD
ncbi:hypothetical protein DFS33DRAFT_1035823 [Desarmillaria ectypa]|nr:hypothetical protein DFS33DRAFT_1035823 [Desarmillaria ectypa]